MLIINKDFTQHTSEYFMSWSLCLYIYNIYVLMVYNVHIYTCTIDFSCIKIHTIANLHFGMPQ